MKYRPVVLLIMDGFGLRREAYGNAIKQAETPNLDSLMSECPYVKGYASGVAVGLPSGQMGNSEVGHMNMGAGRVVYQELTRITTAIESQEFFENPALLSSIENCVDNNSSLHIMGLLSDGGVHSHIAHLEALIELASRCKLKKVYLHLFPDGRDVPPDTGFEYIQQVKEMIARYGVGEIATICGRYYAMDRDKNWDRTELAYNCIAHGEGEQFRDVESVFEKSYQNGESDEFMKPSVIMKDGKPVATVEEDDSVIFFNFRPDRARQLTRAFCDDRFHGFDRGPRIRVHFTNFTECDKTIRNKHIAFRKTDLKNTFGRYIADKGLKQCRIAETEKYAHVTFFFNGGVEEPNEGEDRILVPSPKDVPTYDKKPEMSIYKVCRKLCEAIKSKKYDAIICNFANPDMVGHTGKLLAAIKAIEAVDACVGKACDAVRRVGGVMFICADHGNAEMMIGLKRGRPHTAHTTNPVPFILFNADPGIRLREGGALADIAPTMLELMGLEQPSDMTGKSLIYDIFA